MSVPATPSHLLITLCHTANAGSLLKGNMMEDTVLILLYTTFKTDQTGHYNSRELGLLTLATTTKEKQFTSFKDRGLVTQLLTC